MPIEIQVASWDAETGDLSLEEIAGRNKYVWLPDCLIDSYVQDESVDELISINRIRSYLDIKDVHTFLDMEEKGRLPYLRIIRVGRTVCCRISDLRRYLKWRQLTWNAWDAEILVCPQEVLYYFEEPNGKAFPPSLTKEVVT